MKWLAADEAGLRKCVGFSKKALRRLEGLRNRIVDSEELQRLQRLQRSPTSIAGT